MIPKTMMGRHEWSPFNPNSKERLNKYLNDNLAIKALNDFKQNLMKVILSRVSNKKQAQALVTRFLEMIAQLQESKFGPMVTFGNTLWEWREEIVRMWRFSKTKFNYGRFTLQNG